MTNSKKQLPLHKFINKGGKPKDYKGAQGVSESTVPNIRKKSTK